ncbi:MAG: phosphate ABC transporter permease subunit PstC [Moraxellaceae bacterium]|nr:MAG: phosphate ABC transporter permease subunit PstC [Moraxellaceae bacterium]
MGLTVLLLLLIVAFLILEAWPAIHGDGWRQFLRSDGWYPLEGKLGLLPMFWASIAVGVGALLVALPFGLGSAVFIAYYAPKVIGKPFAGVITLLAGVPSVVFGLWGLTELVPLVNQWHPPGASLFTAIIVLAIMILPTISLTSYSALLALPTQLQLNSAALALSKKTMVVGVLIPAAWRGITVGVLLAIARALGETLAVLMVAGNVVQMPTGLFEPVRVLTANIALEMAYATDNHRAALFASGLMLMFVVFLIALGASKLSKKEMSPI